MEAIAFFKRVERTTTTTKKNRTFRIDMFYGFRLAADEYIVNGVLLYSDLILNLIVLRAFYYRRAIKIKKILGLVS